MWPFLTHEILQNYRSELLQCRWIEELQRITKLGEVRKVHTSLRKKMGHDHNSGEFKLNLYGRRFGQERNDSPRELANDMLRTIWIDLMDFVLIVASRWWWWIEWFAKLRGIDINVAPIHNRSLMRLRMVGSIILGRHKWIRNRRSNRANNCIHVCRWGVSSIGGDRLGELNCNYAKLRLTWGSYIWLHSSGMIQTQSEIG